MPTTSNFGWTTPADTDLVKDGAAAIRTLGNGIDTSFIDLKGGTTGQVLSKASNTDLDYSWVTPNVGDITEVQAGTGISVASGTGPIPVITNTVATAFDAAGDLVYGTGADTFTKLALGTAGQVLTVNSGATAPEWKSPAGGGKILQVVSGSTTTETSTTSTTFSDTTLSVSITPSSTSSKVLLFVQQCYYGSKSADNNAGAIRLLRGSTAIYTMQGGDSLGALYLKVQGTSQIDALVHIPIVYLDSPSTTSSTTYKTQVRIGASQTVTTQLQSIPSTIIAMEVGA